MKKLIMSICVFAAMSSMSFSFADDDDDHRERRHNRSSSVSMVPPPAYQKECGSCHFAFPAQYLSAGNWDQLMKGLDKHFGDAIELAANDKTEIGSYLANNAGADDRFSSADLRVTTTRWFPRKHHEVSLRSVQDNPQVKSFANCGACHPRGDKGSFDEHEVQIPGRKGRGHD